MIGRRLLIMLKVLAVFLIMGPPVGALTFFIGVGINGIIETGNIADAGLDLRIDAWGHFRDVVGDDTVLIDALWVLMPPYVGGARRLYRGEIASNLRDRTYGMSWTGKLDIASGFAEGARIAPGGSAVISCVAPPDAIISALASDDSGESEYLVDRRRLRRIRVIKRYPEIGRVANR
jgi:hypothetical protein